MLKPTDFIDVSEEILVVQYDNCYKCVHVTKLKKKGGQITLYTVHCDQTNQSKLPFLSVIPTNATSSVKMGFTAVPRDTL